MGVSVHPNQPPQPPEHLLEDGVQKTVPPELPQRGFLAGTQSCSTLHNEINVEGEIFLIVEKTIKFPAIVGIAKDFRNAPKYFS